MASARTAKLFKNGASQAVRLPAEFRFSGEEVNIRRNPKTGEVILSPVEPQAGWGAFFELARSIQVPENFMSDRPLNTPAEERSIFGDE